GIIDNAALDVLEDPPAPIGVLHQRRLAVDLGVESGVDDFADLEGRAAVVIGVEVGVGAHQQAGTNCDVVAAARAGGDGGPPGRVRIRDLYPRLYADLAQVGLDQLGRVLEGGAEAERVELDLGQVC